MTDLVYRRTEKTGKSRYIICSSKKPPKRLKAVAFSHRLVSISSAFYLCLISSSAHFSNLDVLFLTSACTASILVLVSAPAEQASGTSMSDINSDQVWWRIVKNHPPSTEKVAMFSQLRNNHNNI